MLFADYIRETEENAHEWIEENKDHIDRTESMVDVLWCEDSVTGNGSGSYTFSSSKAWDNVAGSNWLDCLLFDDEFTQELEDIGETVSELFARGPEVIDVTARVLALYHIDFDAILSKVFADDSEEA